MSNPEKPNSEEPLTQGWSASSGYSWRDRLRLLRAKLVAFSPLSSPWLSLAALLASVALIQWLTLSGKLGRRAGPFITWSGALQFVLLLAAYLSLANASKYLPRAIRLVVVVVLLLALPVGFFALGLHRHGVASYIAGFVFVGVWLSSLQLVPAIFCSEQLKR